jgi:hypothetical protein
MAYRVDFDSTNRILRCRLRGRVTDEDIRRYYRNAGDHVAQADPLAGILDLTGVTSFEVSPTTIRELAKAPSAFPNPDHPRFVIATSPTVFGLARMFEMQGQENRPNLHVVGSEREALAILGIQKTKFAPLQMK